jgi:hypothetical protein
VKDLPYFQEASNGSRAFSLHLSAVTPDFLQSGITTWRMRNVLTLQQH